MECRIKYYCIHHKIASVELIYKSYEYLETIFSKD